jgi:hypothetical protein
MKNVPLSLMPSFTGKREDIFGVRRRKMTLVPRTIKQKKEEEEKQSGCENKREKCVTSS